MRPRPRSAFFSIALFAGSVVLAASDGCTPNQGEGERCVTVDDCQSGLICDQTAKVCCQPTGCKGIVVADTGGDTSKEGGTDTSPADTTDAGGDSFGRTCTHTKDCDPPLVCLPGGACGYQCLGNRDCTTLVADSHCDCARLTCQSGTSGGADDCTKVDAGADAPADTTPPADTATSDVTDAGDAD